MIGETGAGWITHTNSQDTDDIPLWKALALLTAEDLDEGLKVNAGVINSISLKYKAFNNFSAIISTFFAFLFIIAFFVSLKWPASNEANIISLLAFALLAVAAAPHLLLRIHQFGLNTPDDPLKLPHASDPHFEEVLSHLQKANGSVAYYRSRFGKKQINLNRRQFFCRPRYLLFSEHASVRGLVMRFPTILSIPTDIFLHRVDVEKMIAMLKPKRKGGPGRKAKYAYGDAIISLLGDGELLRIDPADRATAIDKITKKLSGWFENNADESGDIPRVDQLQPFAEKILERLKDLPPS